MANKHEKGKHLNHLTPIGAGLLPVGLAPIKFAKRDKAISSYDIINFVGKMGMSYREIGLNLFREGKFGKPRALSNVDLVNGYPFYGSGDIGVRNISAMQKVVSELTDATRSAIKNPILLDMENEDLDKITILRPTHPGRHLQPPMALDFKETNFTPEFVRILDLVIDRYKSARSYHKAGKAAILDGTDAKATALGAPTFQSDEAAYHQYRRIVLRATPPPDYHQPPEEFIKSVLNVGEQFLPSPELMFSSYLSYRQGGIRPSKPIPLWYPSGNGWQAVHDSYSVYSRQRAVWAAPFWLNVVITPLVLAMKSSRQGILGMWHAPEYAAKYIPKLQAQGKYSYEVDYSGYDTTIPNKLMRYVYDKLARVGFSPWEARLMVEVTESASAITPSFTPEAQSVAFFQGNITLMSGLLTTSELGSIISIALVLYALSKQIPSAPADWAAGRFVVLVQSDDVLFTINKPLNEEAFIADIARCGITAKLKAGSTFLKRFLPVGTLSKPSRPFSRLLQQTFANEDRYDGKIDAILRLGLFSRVQGIEGHPNFKELWPSYWGNFLEKYPYTKDLDHSSWSKGLFVLPNEDAKAIQQYATSLAGVNLLTNLLERAKYDPAAYTVLMNLQRMGIDLSNLVVDQRQARAEYTHDLFSPTNPGAINDLIKICKWSR